MVQGSQALECAALDKEAYENLIDCTMNLLLKNKKQLWDNNEHIGSQDEQDQSSQRY